jgi:hypothetical protein
MPPRRGGGVRERRKPEQNNSRTGKPTTITPLNNLTDDSNRQTTHSKPNYEIAPLIVETESLTKVKLSYLIKNHMPEVNISNIQLNRPNTFTLYANDVKSFNQLLNELPTVIQTNENQRCVVYIPRSIQRIFENNKQVFVKKIDLEINEEDIKQSLDEKGYKFDSITRLQNKDKISLKTIKITFADSTNRDLFVKLGLQIDSMHFIAEAANHNNKPSQCYKCFKYDHVGKYCRADNQICSRCAVANHKHDECPNTDKQPICCNCKGEHTATSSDCPKYLQYQQRIQRTIDQYPSSTKQTKTAQMQLNWNIKEEFPVLKSANNIDQMPIIETQRKSC